MTRYQMRLTKLLVLAVALTAASDAGAKKAQSAQQSFCRLEFYNGKRVTPSLFALKVGQRRFIVDCGLGQGGQQERAINKTLPKQALDAEALLLTHAHIDHSGRVPMWVKQLIESALLRKQKIYGTEATISVVKSLLEDSANLQVNAVERKKKWMRRRARKLNTLDQAELERIDQLKPLYTPQDVQATLPLLEAIKPGQLVDLGEGVSAEFSLAGHVLGAASVTFRIKDGKHNGQVLFSGDIGRPNALITPKPTAPKGAQFVVMEGTYGGRNHPPVGDVKETLAKVVAQTIARGGKLIIPAFSYGRTQEVIYLLKQLQVEGRLPDVPILLDSPLAIKLTAATRKYAKQYLNEEVKQFIAKYGDPFALPNLQVSESVEASREAVNHKGPAIVIAGSGMMNGGRVVHHAKAAISDPKNAILLAGHQAEGTLGRQIELAGQAVGNAPQTVKIWGEDYKLGASVHRLKGLSGHAGQSELLGWAAKHAAEARQIFLVHGDETQLTALSEQLTRTTGKRVSIPEANSFFELF
ncbi:MAG: MBL fold metallo-hydrolase [Deltaproteobacteria bacterium]|nr:MBL fold metallo-hydrolase [Deltaproteobacteria bacterium]